MLLYCRICKIVLFLIYSSAMNNLVVGVDLGASKIALSLVSPANELVASRRFATEAQLGPISALTRIAQAITQMTTEAQVDIGAVGVCSPGPVDHVAGLILDPPNLPGWRNVLFRQMLAEKLSVPVALEHDGKAAALGEFYFGVGRERGASDLAYIIVGTGVGAAFILDGQLYRGRTNSAGEVGHITLNRLGAPGSAGVPGCVESFMSGPALVQHYAQRAGAASANEVSSGADVVRRATQGDTHALAVMNDAGDALGAAIATMAMLMDVDLYVIGGSVAKAGDVLLEPARKALTKYAFQSVASRITVVATRLHEAGAILGCAWQARQLLLTSDE